MTSGCANVLKWTFEVQQLLLCLITLGLGYNVILLTKAVWIISAIYFVFIFFLHVKHLADKCTSLYSFYS